MPNIGLFELLMVATILGIPVLLIFTLWKRSQRTPVEAWAKAHHVVLTTRTKEVVAAHLARNLKWRMSGAIVGAALPLGTNVPGLEMIAGYLVGAILAELSAKPFDDVPGRGAAVAPRFVETYIPRSSLVWFRILCGIGTLTAASFFIIPLRADDGITNEPLAFGLTSGGSLLLLAVIEMTLRHLAGRSQNGTSEDVVAADDALRSAAMHATLGAGMALAFLLIGAAALGIGIATDVQLLRWVGAPVAIVCFVSALTSWVRLGPDTPWSVSRLPDREAHA